LQIDADPPDDLAAFAERSSAIVRRNRALNLQVYASIFYRYK